jgi:hypothetical protein
MDDLLRTALKKTLSENNDVMACEVLSVDKVKVLCQVKSIENEDLILEDVRLRAVDDEQDKGLILFPQVGSTVLVGQIKNTTAYYIAMYSAIDKVKWVTEQTDMKTIWLDLLSAIKALTVPTGMGPSGVPINLGDFTNIETKINQFFE